MPPESFSPSFSVQFDSDEKKPLKRVEKDLHIQVIGVGGGGGSIIAECSEANLEGVNLWAANTDSQALERLNDLDINTLNLGKERTEGAGGNPEIGAQLAAESTFEILQILENTRLLFVVACMGGGTGTGAAPVIARCGKEAGILTVGIVTRPRELEQRGKRAEEGIQELRNNCHALMVFPNDNAFPPEEDLDWKTAVGNINQRLVQSIQVICDMLFEIGVINRDFKDLETCIPLNSKKALDLYIGIAEASGTNRRELIKEQILDVSLHELSLHKLAFAHIINFTSNNQSGESPKDSEMTELVNTIKGTGDQDTEQYIGLYESDQVPEGSLRVSVIMPMRSDEEASTVTTTPDEIFSSVPPSRLRAVEPEEQDEDDVDWGEITQAMLDADTQDKQGRVDN